MTIQEQFLQAGYVNGNDQEIFRLAQLGLTCLSFSLFSSTENNIRHHDFDFVPIQFKEIFIKAFKTLTPGIDWTSTRNHQFVHFPNLAQSTDTLMSIGFIFQDLDKDIPEAITINYKADQKCISCGYISIQLEDLDYPLDYLNLDLLAYYIQNCFSRKQQEAFDKSLNNLNLTMSLLRKLYPIKAELNKAIEDLIFDQFLPPLQLQNIK